MISITIPPEHNDIEKRLIFLLHISDSQIKKYYSMKECLQDVEKAFTYYQTSNVITPVRLSLAHAKKAHTLYMPSYVEKIAYASVKIISIFPNNAKRNKETLQSMIVLTETESGDHVATLDASYLTVMRTGAISGLGTKYLAREDATILSVIGCGSQAIGQILAMLEVRPITKILLTNRTVEKAHQLKNKLLSLFANKNLTIEVVKSANDAVSEADIVVCSTSSSTPVFSGEALKRGTHINAIGSYQPQMQEIDSITLQRSNKIVVDTKEGAEHEAGDLLIPHQNGEWSLNRIYCELGDLIVGNKNGRERDDEVTLLNSVGVAFLDTICASSIYQKIKKLNEL